MVFGTREHSLIFAFKFFCNFGTDDFSSRDVSMRPYTLHDFLLLLPTEGTSTSEPGLPSMHASSLSWLSTVPRLFPLYLCMRGCTCIAAYATRWEQCELSSSLSYLISSFFAGKSEGGWNWELMVLFARIRYYM